MPKIAFHFNAPDKLAYACRLLRKATAGGVRLMVTAPTDELVRLDTLLWTFSQTDFIAHARAPGHSDMLQASPVVLAETSAAADLAHREVLLNLGGHMPAGFEAFERVIEVVSLDEEDRQLARVRWKHYQGLGYDIQRHDLNLKS
ncbi:MAG: DNA polymerase III subunit chi [Curvibacter sp.]|jgi:DNA polymerase-3 subunit chi